MKKAMFWDRVLIYLLIIMTVALTVVTALRVFDVDPVEKFYINLYAAMPDVFVKMIVCGIGIIIILLAFFTARAITPKQARKHDFIDIKTDDNNHVRISLVALQDLTRQAMKDFGGLSDIAIDIYAASHDAVNVNITMDVQRGAHVPTLTTDIQQGVKKYINESCGVTVSNVFVTVKSVLDTPVMAMPTYNEPVTMPEMIEQPVVEQHAIEQPVEKIENTNDELVMPGFEEPAQENKEVK